MEGATCNSEAALQILLTDFPALELHKQVRTDLRALPEEQPAVHEARRVVTAIVIVTIADDALAVHSEAVSITLTVKLRGAKDACRGLLPVCVERKHQAAVHTFVSLGENGVATRSSGGQADAPACCLRP